MGTLIVPGIVGVLIKPTLFADTLAGLAVTSMSNPTDVVGTKKVT